MQGKAKQNGEQQNLQDASTLDAKAVAVYAEQAKDQGVVAFLLDVIPGSVIALKISWPLLPRRCRAKPNRTANSRTCRMLPLAKAKFLAGHLRHHQYDYAPGADRRLRGHGLHHR
jgi:hypothetical protein